MIDVPTGDQSSPAEASDVDAAARRVPTLDAYRDGPTLRVWCRYCCLWHTHGGGAQPGDADGHRVAHCRTLRSPYRDTGYRLREVGPWTGRGPA